MLLNGIIA